MLRMNDEFTVILHVTSKDRVSASHLRALSLFLCALSLVRAHTRTRALTQDRCCSRSSSSCRRRRKASYFLRALGPRSANREKGGTTTRIHAILHKPLGLQPLPHTYYLAAAWPTI